MIAFRTQPVFRLAGRWFDWGDVVADIERTGWWTDLLATAASDLARRTEASDPGALAEAVDAAATAFRYRNGLISASDAEAWLARRGVTIAEWLDWVRRDLTRDPGGLRLGPRGPGRAQPAGDVERAAWVAAVCSGAALRNARVLAGRAAGAVAGGAALERSGPPALAHAIRAGLEAFRARLLVPEAILEEISRRRLDWVCITGRAVDLADAGAAAEAVLCVRGDGLDIDAVATVAHAGAAPFRTLLEKLDPVVRPAFRAAVPGEVVGPFEVGGRYRIVAIDAKTAPSSDDPAIAACAERSIVARALQREAGERVLWAVDW